jgi:hypothetical protein
LTAAGTNGMHCNHQKMHQAALNISLVCLVVVCVWGWRAQNSYLSTAVIRLPVSHKSCYSDAISNHKTLKRYICFLKSSVII